MRGDSSKHTKSTSWENSGNWYNKLVGDKGHYYHQHIVIPGVVRLLNLTQYNSVLDIGCGQGVLSRHIDLHAEYVGVDLAKNLISFAKEHDRNSKHSYIVADATKPLPLQKKDFSHAVAILSLQNMENQEGAITQAATHVQSGGIFVFVLNHPCFRIPRQSGWGVSENKQQYRYVNRYISPMKIPITMHPGEKASPVTWSFHYPISFYTTALHNAGFIVETMEEWVSDKESVGKAAKMENRSRSEIPLFLAVVARKK